MLTSVNKSRGTGAYIIAKRASDMAFGAVPENALISSRWEGKMPKLPTTHITRLGIGCIVAAMLSMPQEAGGQGGDRGGKEVVDTFCAECHATGANDAPKIGDEAAWRKRASAGLTALTKHALDGIRQMPPHGGQPQLSDLEIARAVAYMVNASGGDWVAPKAGSAMLADRTGQQVYQAYCSQCHETGKNGAPRIGDKQAWIPRLREGLHYAVRSAISGHGGMPPRGGAADLADSEIRNAIVYMFDPSVAVEARNGKASGDRVVTTDANQASVYGIEIYLGFASVERIREFPPGSVEKTMHGGVPSGENWYHLNVSLLDQETHAPVTDADVDVRITDSGRAVMSKTLEPMAIGRGSYGGYFRMTRETPYGVTVSVRAPAISGPVEARFRRKQVR